MQRVNLITLGFGAITSVYQHMYSRARKSEESHGLPSVNHSVQYRIQFYHLTESFSQ